MLGINRGMKRLHTKPCKICGTPIEGVKRADRNAYRYSPRCPDCAYKTFDPELLAKKRRIAEQNRVVLPIGTTRTCKRGDGLVYQLVKTKSGWEYEHRVIAGTPAGFHTHHRNHDTLDNAPDNLVVLSNAKHRAEHGLNGKWARDYDACMECKSTERRHLSFGLCTACYQRKGVLERHR